MGRGAALSAGSQLLAALLAWLTGVLVARLLGPEGAGEYGVILVLLLALISFSGSGIAGGVAYELSRAPQDPRSVVRQILVGAGLLGALGFGIGAAATELLSNSAFRGIDQRATLFALAGLPPALAWIYFQHVGLAREAYGLYAAAPIVQTLSCLAATAVLGATADLHGAAIALGVSHLIAAALAFALIRRELGAEPKGRLAADLARLRRAVVYGAKTYVFVALNFVALRIDLLVLNAFVSARQVGQYAVAVSIVGLAPLLPRGLSPIVFARIASITEDDAASDAVSARALRHAVLLILVAGIAVTGALALVPTVYGADFAEGTKLGFILLPGACALGMANVVQANFMGRGRADYAAYTALVVGPAAILAYFLLIPAYEAEGAALASSLVYMLSLVIALYYLRQSAGTLDIRWFTPGRDEIADYRRLLRR